MKLKVSNDTVDGIKWAHTLTENTFDKDTSLKIDRWFNLYKDLGRDKIWKDYGKEIQI